MRGVISQSATIRQTTHLRIRSPINKLLPGRDKAKQKQLLNTTLTSEVTLRGVPDEVSSFSISTDRRGPVMSCVSPKRHLHGGVHQSCIESGSPGKNRLLLLVQPHAAEARHRRRRAQQS